MVYSAVDREEADRHFLRVLFFCNFWLLLFGFSDSLLFGWREAKTGNTSAFVGYPTAVTRQNRLRSRLPNWRMLNKTTEGVSDLLEDNSMCWRTSISRGTHATTVFCKISAWSKHFLEWSITWGQLKMSRWPFHSSTVFEVYVVDSVRLSKV